MDAKRRVFHSSLVCPLTLGFRRPLPVAIEAAVDHPGHLGGVEGQAEEIADAFRRRARILQHPGVEDIDYIQVGRALEQPVDLPQMVVVELDHALVGSLRGFAPALEHLGLGSQNLMDVTAHEQDLVVVMLREILEQEGDDLDRLAFGLHQPGLVLHGAEILDPFVFIVALRVVLVGRADAIDHQRQATGLEHFHGHGGSGTGQPGNHDDRVTIAQPPIGLTQKRHVGYLLEIMEGRGIADGEGLAPRPKRAILYWRSPGRALAEELIATTECISTAGSLPAQAQRSADAPAQPEDSLEDQKRVRVLIRSRHPFLSALLLVAALLTLALPAHAYIGPGAGFALLSSFMVVFTTIILAIFSILLWPFRKLWRLIKRGKQPTPLVRRLIVVGLDGQDPQLTDRFMQEGKLPNFEKLAASGCYHRLRSTFPSVSPVAWSSFSTGTHPAKHNIFDFLDRDLRSYLPLLSSTRIGRVERFFKLGKYRIPLHKPELRLMRKSKPFWTILGEHHIWSTVLRVPITFPPDNFYGAELSAMCVPDLLGTQGTFLLYTTRPAEEKFKEGGVRLPLEFAGDRCETALEGPGNSFLEGEPPLSLPLVIDLDRAANRANITVGDEQLELEPGTLSPWITLTFPAAPMVKVSGICRMQITEMDEHVSLYIAPISLDPENPAMPVSHPSYYSTYLAKKIGPYSTLGLAEDTWALNEGVIDDATFLKQTYDVDDEREEMFFAALDRLRQGTLTCVFDATDRIQHMFWRYLEDGHPAARGLEDAEHKNAIEEHYKRNDDLVGRVLEKTREGDVVMVISDHGFSSFRRGVNLNSWLHAEGYLTLKEGCDGSSEWLRDVDWSKTRAYVLGLTGMFLNLEGREEQGIVKPGKEAEALKAELNASSRT